MQLSLKITSTIALLFAFVANGYADAQSLPKKAAKIPKLTPVWQVEGLSVPESVLEVKEGRQHYFLVSLIDGAPSEKDGLGGIAKISTSGEIIDAEWVAGLNAPKGMATHKKWLYVTDIDTVIAIDLNSPDVRVTIPVEGAVFLNDVAVDKRGNVYVSDTGAGRIIKIEKNIPNVYLENVPSANGLFAKKDGLLVGAGPNLLFYKSNKRDEKPKVLTSGLPFGIDGVAPISRGNFLVSVWEGRIYWIDRKGGQTLLLDSIEAEINTADFAYSRSKKLVVVPNFFSNTVTAYKLR